MTAINKEEEIFEVNQPSVRPHRWLSSTWSFLRDWPVIPVIILIGLVMLAILADTTGFDEIKPILRDRTAAPGAASNDPALNGRVHLLGADQFGRDILTRIMYGARVSLIVMAIAATSGMIVGTIYGLVAGYYGGIVDEFMMRLLDIWFAVPFLLLALVTIIVLGQTFIVLLGLLAFLAWPPFVRNVRAEVLSLKEREYVMAARVAGASTWRILFHHLLPGVINTIIVIATLRVGQLILAEAGLSYLGAGIPPPTPAWGALVSDGRDYLNDAWWIAVFPGIAIFLLVMALNFIGDWFRDRFDPRLRQL